LKMMRNLFEKKLSNATHKIMNLKMSYENEIQDLQRTLNLERAINEKKIQKFKERCNFLEERLQKLY
jgi:hypothetical protein